jgi:hypothetical protein
MSSQLITLDYSPLPHQRRLHRSSRRVRLLRGGVGSGKTRGGAVDALLLAAANPGCDGMIVAPTWGILHRTTLRSFLSAVPPSLIRAHHRGERYVELVDGSRAYYASADRPETLEGADLAWAWGDELRYWRREAWEILLARVRSPRARKPAITLTSTPAMGWMYDAFANDPAIDDIHASTMANPHLSQEYLDALRRSYSPSLWQAYVEGEWVALEGAVFAGEFGSENIVPGLGVNVREVSLALDFGVRHAAVIAYIAHESCPVHGNRCIHVIDEWMPDDTPTYRLAASLGAWLEARGWRCREIVCDPAGNARSTQTGIRDTEILQRAGYDVVWTTDAAARSVRYGIDLVRSRLRPVAGRPSMFFDGVLTGDGSCDRGVVSSLRGAIWDRRGEAYEKDGRLDHALDALRYAAILDEERRPLVAWE